MGGHLLSHSISTHLIVQSIGPTLQLKAGARCAPYNLTTEAGVTFSMVNHKDEMVKTLPLISNV